MNLLDLIFPKRCINCRKLGSYICTDCFSRLSFDTYDICPECSRPAVMGITHPRCKKKHSLEGVFSAVVLNSVSKKLVYKLKYRPYLSDLKNMVGELTYESLSQNEEIQRVYQFHKDKLILVPIPLFEAKKRKRGYNQAEILAKEFSKRFGLPVSDLLIRTRDTHSQVKLDRDKRRQNIREAFKFAGKENVRRKYIFLVDDVLTTGATLSEAGKVLRKAGAEKVWGIALAKEK